MNAEPKVYLKKRQTILAIEWTGNNLEEVIQFVSGKVVDVDTKQWEDTVNTVNKDGLILKRHDEILRVAIGDYITRDRLGICKNYKPNEFHQIYDEVV